MEAAKLSLDTQESTLEGLRDATKIARDAVNEAQKVLNAIEKYSCWQETIFGWLGDWVKETCNLNPAYAGAEESLNAAREALSAKERFLSESLNAIVNLKKLREDLDRKIVEAEKAIADPKIVRQAANAQLEVYHAQRRLEVEGAARHRTQ